MCDCIAPKANCLASSHADVRNISSSALSSQDVSLLSTESEFRTAKRGSWKVLRTQSRILYMPAERSHPL